MWILLGTYALANVAWLVAGREHVRIEQGTLILEQMIGSLGRRRRYDLSAVTNLRLVPRTRVERMQGMTMPFGFGRHGSLAFDHGPRVVQWGGGLDEREARAIVGWLEEQNVGHIVHVASVVHATVSLNSHRLPWQLWVARLIAIPFTVTLVLHILTFLGLRLSNRAEGAVLVSLVLPLFLAWGAMVFNHQFTSVESDLPADRKSVFLGACLVIYAILNFVICLGLMEGGSPELTASGYILSNHGAIIRPLTEVEYWKMKAYELRLFTGHFLVFLGVPMLYFRYANHRCANGEVLATPRAQ